MHSSSRLFSIARTRICFIQNSCLFQPTQVTKLVKKNPSSSEHIPTYTVLHSPHHVVEQIRQMSSRDRIRRRRGLEEDKESDGDKNGKNDISISSNIRMVKDKATFLELSHAFLNKAAIALEPMKACNEVFHIQRSNNEQGEVLKIVLKPSEGQYVMQVDNDLLTLSLRSPMSGNYTYVLCKKTHEFIGMEDDHALEGMLVRDLIRHCNGLPKF